MGNDRIKSAQAQIEAYLVEMSEEAERISREHQEASKRRAPQERSQLYLRVTVTPNRRGLSLNWYYTRFWRKQGNGKKERIIEYLGSDTRKLKGKTKEWERELVAQMVEQAKRIQDNTRKANKALRLLDSILRETENEGDNDQ